MVKLKKLYVQRYKNLVDFSVDFQSGNGLTMFVGNNGSGKSNVLEVISGVFHDLYKEKAGRKIIHNYTLEYIMDDVNCKIEQINGTLRCYGTKYKSRAQFILENAPSNIIGLYSGEEDRLWVQFYESYYKAYLQRIKTHHHQERMRLMFINKYYWNIALLTLLLSSNDTLKPFIENELGINSVSRIQLIFNFRNYESANELLKAFVDKINPEHRISVVYSIDDLRKAIFYSSFTDDSGEVLLMENGTNDIEVFRWFAQAYMPKNDKIISDIKIHITDDITVEQLSEGEKKLILVKTVLEVLADEKTLLLMDEPDAHLHESRKPVLCKMMREYSNRQIIVATHSPVMGQLAKDNELLMLDAVDGVVTIFDEAKIQKIKRLTGTTWDVVGQGLMLKSQRPLVVFEGKTDVMYTKRALELLSQSIPKYTALNVDFLNANGAGNVKTFIENLKSLVSENKKIIVFFDRDKAGKDGAKAITGISLSDERIVHYQDIVQGNITVSFIPYKDGISDGDFLIEDYFSWDGTIKTIVYDIFPERKHPVKSLPNLAERVKSEIEKRLDQFKSDEFSGFSTLLDKIIELSSGETR